MSKDPQSLSQATDPMEAIFALNIGDFVAESFISDELLGKIANRLADNPDKLKAQLEELVQIYAMDKTLSILGFSNTDGFVIYDSICATLASMAQVDACHLFEVSQKDTGEQYLSLSGTSKPVEGAKRWEIGVQTKANDFLSDALKYYGDEDDIQVVPNVAKLPNWHPIDALNQAQVVSALSCPLKEGGKQQGLLVFETYSAQDFPEELHRLAKTTARILVTAARLQHLVAQVQGEIPKENANLNMMLNLRAQITESIADLGIHQQEFIETLAEAIDARHHHTKGHSKRVAELARTFGEALALNEKTLDLIYYAGLFGSLGKVHISSDVLSKKGQLSDTEREELRNHPNVGVSLLGKINFMSETMPYVQSQKESWDGTGGPEGLKGLSIPLGARILALADAYYAMTSERPYREKTLSHEEAIAALQREAGTRWDPALVAAIAKLPADVLQ